MTSGSPRGRDRQVAAAALAVVALTLGLAPLGLIAALPWSLSAATMNVLWVSLITVSLAVVVAAPIGVGAAIYLEEYRREDAAGRLLGAVARLLADLPAVLFGLVGLELYLQTGGRFGVAAACLALSLWVAPRIIVTTRTALRGVPPSLRETGLALGASRWRVTRALVVPAAARGVAAAVLRATARAFGEAAPLVFVAAAVGRVDPTAPVERASASLQIFAWLRADNTWLWEQAAALGAALLGLVLALNWLAARVAR